MSTSVRDQAGKRAYVRAAVSEGSEYQQTLNGYRFYVDVRTGRYYAVKGEQA